MRIAAPLCGTLTFACLLALVLPLPLPNSVADDHVRVGSSWPPPQLANTTICDNLGFQDIEKFQFGLKLSPPTWLDAAVDSHAFMPLYASVPLMITNPKIVRAVIWMHGLSGNANTYFCDGVTAAKDNDAGDTTLSIAPWFGSTQVKLSQWDGSSDGNVSVYWNTSDWLIGGNNSPNPKKYTSSFAVLDEIVDTLVAQNNNGVFPNLQAISFVGFSAGAQLATRWAVFSSRGDTTTNLENGDSRIGVRIVVGDGSSYPYLDANRPNIETCSPLRDTGVNHNCSKFAAPVFGTVSRGSTIGYVRIGDDCPMYDVYKYGLSHLDLVRHSMYLAPFVLNPALVKDAISRYLRKDVRFIFGSQDVCNCNIEGYSNSQSSVCYPNGNSCTPDAFGGSLHGSECCDTFPDSAVDNALDTHCGAMLQGSNRLQRGLNYVRYLSWYASQNHLPQDNEPLFDTFIGAHDNAAFYASASFKKWVFQ